MKYIKLVLLSLVIVVSIVGLTLLIPEKNKIEVPEYSSAQANMWKQKIIDLCTGDAWTSAGYTKIETGIRTDRKMSQGELITTDEELSLQRFLFASSCACLKDLSDAHFKQSGYSDQKITFLDNMLALLSEKKSDFAENSNYNEASKLISSYHTLMSLLSFGSVAKYSRPLQAYNGGSSNGRKAKIQGLPFYKSHFSNNTQIVKRVSSLEREMEKAEQEYYVNLVKCIEDNARKTKDLVILLEDQIRLDEISTNPKANRRLDEFIKNF